MDLIQDLYSYIWLQLIMVWITVVVLNTIISIVILIIDKDNPNSIRYMLLLSDINLAAWPPLLWISSKNDKDKKQT